MNRIVKVARMQMLNRNTFIGVPLIVLGGSFALSLLIIAMIPTDNFKFAGGAPFAPFWFYIGAGVYGLTLTFPFSQAMSITRREFFLGTMLSAAFSALCLSVVFVVMGYVEAATGGWWMNGGFFRIPGIWDQGPLVSGLIYFAFAVLLFALGFIFAVIYRRWGVAVLVSLLVALGLALVGAVFIITRMEAWGQTFETLGRINVLGWAGIVCAGVLLISVAAERLLRRTVV